MPKKFGIFLCAGASLISVLVTPRYINAGLEKASFKPSVKFGVITRYNPVIMYKNYQPILDYLTEHTPYRFELKLGKTYEDAVNFLQNRDTDLASFGAVTYIEAHKKYGAKAILRPLNKDGSAFYRSITVVRNDSDIKILSDLRNRSFAFASIKSTSGNLIPRYYLAKAGVHLKDLRSYVNLRHHDSVAKAVLKGEYDAGSMKDVIALKYIPKGLRIIFVSDPIPSVPFAVRNDAPEEFVESVKKALLAIDPGSPHYKKIGRYWDEEFKNGFIEANDSDYDGIRKMLNDIPQGCGKGCHPEIFF